MNASHGSGIELRARVGKLIVSAPKGALTPEIIAALKEHKRELLTFLERWAGPARAKSTLGAVGRGRRAIRRFSGG